MDYFEESLEKHQQYRGKIEIRSKMPVTNKDELSVAYTPGVAEPSRQIHDNPALAKTLTATKNMVAVVTDGSAVLGLGDIGPEAALPVMEGKAVLFKELGGIDAFPIALAAREVGDIVQTVVNIAPTFGGINLEDISAPRCFEIEAALQERLNIPVFHDDQHGTAIVILAGLINALDVVGKEKEKVRVVVSGAGAAGIAATKLLARYGFSNIIVCDSQGIISKNRANLNPYKQQLLEFTNKENLEGSLKDAVEGADIFIGVSVGNILTAEDVNRMAANSIIFAMANPEPEIMPFEAKKGGAAVVATGRSDFPNQINNALVFPGLFKGMLKANIAKVTDEIKIAAAEALARLVSAPEPDCVVPSLFNKNVARTISDAVTRFQG